jgi:hypothetical protein
MNINYPGRARHSVRAVDAENGSNQAGSLVVGYPGRARHSVRAVDAENGSNKVGSVVVGGAHGVTRPT